MLREIGLRGLSRDASVMEKLAEAIVHPSQISESAQESRLLSEETLSGTAAALHGIFPMIKTLIPELPAIPVEIKSLHSWMKSVKSIGMTASNPGPGKKNVRKRSYTTTKSKELFLFDESTI